MLTVNAERLLHDLHTLSHIGLLPAEAGGGVDRKAYSAAERAARAFFTAQSRAFGLHVATDGVGNLSALLPSPNPGAKRLLAGSHLDSVPHGGPYDGALGVLAALEALRTLQEHGITLPVHLEAVAFADEEGRIGELTGGRAFAGSLSEAEMMHLLAEIDGADLAAMHALEPATLTLEALQRTARDPSTILAYLELHIEQGPRLEAASIPIGVVTAIYGRRSFKLIFHGRSDHAGTTPLRFRADALVAASHVVTALHNRVAALGDEVVATCGNLTVRPGQPHGCAGQ
jgi:hydantoinase/carbamoylase family amidase